MPRKVLLLAGIGCISASLFVVELALTRLFSVLMYYHFAFLAISVALFGLSASGVFVYLTPRLHAPERVLNQLRVYALSFSVVTFGTTLALLQMSIPGETSTNTSTSTGTGTAMGMMALVYLVAAAPFFFGGACLTLAVSRLHRDITRVYAFDLGGGAIGCLALIWTLNHLGGPGTLLAASLLGAVGALLFAVSALSAARGSLVVLAYAVPVVLIGVVLGWQRGQPAFDVINAKGVRQYQPLFSRWNSFSRVAVYNRPGSEWGVSEAYRGPRPKSLDLDIDCSAATPIMKAHDLSQVEMLRWELTALGYHLLPPGSRVLVIGPGGGRDLWTALLFHASRVVGVEINPIIVNDVMGVRFRQVAGDIYHRPGVSIAIDDGRSFVRRERQLYDVIQATLVDTWAATAAGAFALSENNLYTVEAFVDYFRHLKPGGLLTMTRWDAPEDGLRLVSVARAAGERLGWANLDGRLFIARQQPHVNATPGTAPLCTFLFKPSRFSTAELSRLRDIAARQRFEVVYPSAAPSSQSDRMYGEVATTAELDKLRAGFRSDLSPSTDDRPFFFQSTRPRDIWRSIREKGLTSGVGVLLSIMVLSTVLVTLGILLPLVLGRRVARRELTRTALGYFACLGAGFMLIEIGQMQRFVLFLGHPVYSLTVILFTLLIGGGVGSALSGRQPTKLVIRYVLPAVIALGVIYAVVLPPLFKALIGLERPLRIAVSVALLLPLGLLLGMPLPAGVRLVARDNADRLAWVWAINGAASVFGASIAMMLAVLFGFTVVAWCGAAVYGCALWLGAVLSRRAAAHEAPAASVASAQ